MIARHWITLLNRVLHVRTLGVRLGKHMSVAARNTIRVGFLLISLYGVHAFVKRGIGDYLLMKVMFAFYDFSEPRLLFFIDYVAVMIFVANIGFYSQSALLRIKER